MKTILETVYDVDKEQFPALLNELIPFLQKKLDSVPGEFRSKVDVDIEARGDDAYLNFELYYSRPESFQEEIDRTAREKEMRGILEHQAKTSELRQLAMLMAKYPEHAVRP